jgi:2Fe-2S ferredoxin
MPKVIYRYADGSTREIEANEGQSVMDTAVKNGVPGIVAECGGACSCATCHVYVSDEWTEKVGGPGDLEDEMLDVAAAERRDSSRLSCQIKMSSAIDGLVVEIPATQV